MFLTLSLHISSILADIHYTHTHTREMTNAYTRTHALNLNSYRNRVYVQIGSMLIFMITITRKVFPGDHKISFIALVAFDPCF